MLKLYGHYLNGWNVFSPGKVIKDEISLWDFGSESIILGRSSPEREQVFYIYQQFENKLESFVRWRLPKIPYIEIQPRLMEYHSNTFVMNTNEWCFFRLLQDGYLLFIFLF